MKKHFLCTHTWASEEAKEQFLVATKDMTDRQMLEGFKTEKAELLQNWMGKEDFFYCHWYAEDEDAIFSALDLMDANNFMVSMPSEMQRYVSYEHLTDKPMVNPFET
tara:strand:- start:118 stop:438 length:321 start_codon:yes stop_codon:yes gene_type:complete